MLAGSADGLRAQNSPFKGSWTQGFSHQVASLPTATDPYAAFPSKTLHPNATDTGFEASFNAVHMSLIPRGKDRGKVIVWNRFPNIMKPNGSFAAGNEWWSFQSWSIVDPAANPVGSRIQNFMLPMHPMGTATPNVLTAVFDTHFCAGHCWSPYGDLVVVGGASTGNSGTGIRTVMLYRPDEVGQAWPLLQSGLWDNDWNGSPLYSGAHGRWNYGPALEYDRYYPTVTLTSRLLRLLDKEVVLVTGGSVSITGGTLSQNPTWNTYEALVLLDPSVQATRVGLAIDSITIGSIVYRTFQGPDDGIAQDFLLEEYPRVHWLGSAQAFTSGYEPLSAKTGHEVPPITPGSFSWDYSTGQTSTGQSTNPTSFVHRHDGSSVLFARFGSLTNFVGRLGGFEDGKATNTAEFLPDAAVNPAPPTYTGWYQAPSMVRPRGWPNAVILPDGAIFVVGGAETTVAPTDPVLLAQWIDTLKGSEVYKNGAWGLGPSTNTLRGYHATAVLLPDARVLVGGGEFRHTLNSVSTPTYDYEVYEPWYMGQPRPSIQSIGQPALLPLNSDGSQQLEYAQEILVDVNLPKFVQPGKVVMMAPGSMTHHSDMHARYVELERVSEYEEVEGPASHDGATMRASFAMPAETLAPRGYYMVFAMTDGGVPSEAAWVQIKQ